MPDEENSEEIESTETPTPKRGRKAKSTETPSDEVVPEAPPVRSHMSRLGLE